MILDEKHRYVLEWMVGRRAIVDEFMRAHPRYYINTWAPKFTELKKAGLIAPTGEKRCTQYGKPADVLQITLDGALALEQLRAGNEVRVPSKKRRKKKKSVVDVNWLKLLDEMLATWHIVDAREAIAKKLREA